LGVDEATEYRETLVTLEPRETLTLYTDGITEAMNHEDQFYGRERLFAQIAAANHGDVTDLGERILGDVKRFVGARTQSDDMCLVCVGRNG